MESGRKGGQVIQLEPETLMGTQKRWNITGSGILPWEWRTRATCYAPKAWSPTTGKQAPLAGLKTSGPYRKAVRNQDSALEEHTHKLAYSWSQPGGSRLKTTWGCSQPARTTTAYSLACTRLLLQPFLLQHCSPLRQRLPLPTKVCTLEGNGANSDPWTCLWPGWRLPLLVHMHHCTHSGGS